MIGDSIFQHPYRCRMHTVDCHTDLSKWPTWKFFLQPQLIEACEDNRRQGESKKDEGMTHTSGCLQ